LLVGQLMISSRFRALNLVENSLLFLLLHRAHSTSIKMPLPCNLRVPKSLCDQEELKGVNYDGIILITDVVSNLVGGELDFLHEPLVEYKKIDSSVGVKTTFHPIKSNYKRLVFAPTGPLDRDYDDVRRYFDAAQEGIKRALQAGIRTPMIVVPPDNRYPQAQLVAALGAMQALYVPLEVREDDPGKAFKICKIGVWCQNNSSCLLKQLKAYESGRYITRDIQGSDPERMAPPRVADYVVEHFKESEEITVEVVSDTAKIEKQYPCLGAVNRAAKEIPRHQARVIKLLYEGEGPITDTIFLVGKGVTYDTGGADVKAGGVMAGMHRDKGGAAAVAGFFEILRQLKPKNLKVYGKMSMVRNSIGPNGYVADEIITSRAGVRVRVGNTDAEGRMAMVDCLCEAKEEALNEVNPHLYTIATLTGHAVIAVGKGYSIAMDNGPARQIKNAQSLQDAGDLLGDPFEISTIRREDYVFHTGKSEYEDTLQCNNQPSSRTPRGHQSPSAFMIMTSGLDKHGLGTNEKHLKYTHLDIAASEGSFPGLPSGFPVTALFTRYVPPL